MHEFPIEQLSVSERLELISLLWDSIPDGDKVRPLPEWHREVLERRIAEADANPGAGIAFNRATSPDSSTPE
jgi:putative addiction module component (TIGR02574 family)